MRALMTAMVSCRLRTSANVRCSWAARCCICRSSARRQRLNARANIQNAPSSSTARPTIITVSNDGLGRISNIAAPVTAVTLRQTTDATSTALYRRKQELVPGEKFRGNSAPQHFRIVLRCAVSPGFFSRHRVQNFALAERKNCRGAPSSSDCHVPFGSVSVKPFESIVLKYSLSVRLVASSWIDSSSNAPEAAEAIARREIHQRVRVDAALVQVRVEALVGVVHVRAREERAVVVRQLRLQQDLRRVRDLLALDLHDARHAGRVDRRVVVVVLRIVPRQRREPRERLSAAAR